jgi:hypothetical protein
LTNVTKIYSTEYAFAALMANGTVVSWGRIDSGGNTSYGGSLGSGIGDGELINVTKIYSTGKAFAALMADGTVLSWGETWCAFGAPCGADLTGVIDIYSTDTAFAAIVEID